MKWCKAKALYPFSVSDTETTRKLIRIARLAPGAVVLSEDDGQELLVAMSPEVFARLLLDRGKSKVF